MNSHNFKMTLAYDGTAYSGWQVQAHVETVQGVLERGLKKLAGVPVKLHGSGRTDRGVHAAGQVAHCEMPGGWQAPDLMRALNALLPPDIRVLGMTRARLAFHARRSAVSKEYRYFIWNGEVLPPVVQRYRVHMRLPLNVPAMRAAARLLLGRHDFAAFTANPNRLVESTIRDLTMLDVRQRGAEITITARADGFLYKMVRSLAGCLMQVGDGSLPASDAAVILTSRIRTARVPTAPPQGLFLWRVFYARR